MIKRGEVFLLNNPLFLGGLVLALGILLFTTTPLDDKYLIGNAVLGEDYIGILEGTWQATEVSEDIDCDVGDIEELSYTMTITQINDQVFINILEGGLKGELKGKLKGDKLSLSGKIEDRDGEFHNLYPAIQIAADCNSFSGKGTTLEAEYGGVCNGIVEFTAVRETGSGCGVPEPVVCFEDWNCSSWSKCSDAKQQVRICTDNNACGIEENKPEELRSCVIEEKVEEKPAQSPAPDLSSGLLILMLVLLVVIIVIAYLLITITGKKRKLAKDLDNVLVRINEDLAKGDRQSALLSYNSLTRQFERVKDHLRGRDKKRIVELSIKAYEELSK